MYLSRIAIDIKKYESMKAMYNFARIHGMIESSFPGERKRKLWRIDRLSGEDYLLLLSPDPPKTNNLPEQIGYDNSVWETKSYDGLLSRITKDSKWHFRLTANPTVSIVSKGDKRGKVKAVTIAHKQREWLKRQGSIKGFYIDDKKPNTFDVVKSEWKTFKKGGREIQILSVTFEGVLSVTDPETFCNTLTEGIGREKAYGMGLLTVMPYA